MKRESKLFVCFMVLMLHCQFPLASQQSDAEKERLARKVENLMESYGNPLKRSGLEYFGASIDPKTGNVSHLYEDVDGRVRRGKMFKLNHLFNLSKIDPESIEVYNNIRWWTIRFNARKGEKIPVHSVIWSRETKKNEDDWSARDEIEQFCGMETEGKARELADYLRSLARLYQ